jgi:hypothetical protein
LKGSRRPVWPIPERAFIDLPEFCRSDISRLLNAIHRKSDRRTAEGSVDDWVDVLLIFQCARAHCDIKRIRNKGLDAAAAA